MFFVGWLKRALPRNPPSSVGYPLTIFRSLREIYSLCVFAPLRLCVSIFQQPDLYGRSTTKQTDLYGRSTTQTALRAVIPLAPPAP